MSLPLLFHLLLCQILGEYLLPLPMNLRGMTFYASLHMTLLELENNWQHLARNISNTANALAPVFHLSRILSKKQGELSFQGSSTYRAISLKTSASGNLYNFLRHVRFLNPARPQSLQATLLNDLSKVRFLNPTAVKELKDEFPIYIASTKDITTEIGPKDAFRWWRMQSNSLPKWSKFTKKIACVQPTSAAAERVFLC